MKLASAFLLLAGMLLIPSCKEAIKTEQSPRQPSLPSQFCETPDFNGENALLHTANIVAIGDRSPASSGARKQLNYIAGKLRQYGWFIQEQSFEQWIPSRGKNVTFTNLRARFGEAPSFTDPSLGILSCHIDTKTDIHQFVGANDGASGAAVIIEVARILAQSPACAGKVELVFFDGEEAFAPNMTETDGLYGSKYYAAQLSAQELPHWLINLDMVGRNAMKIRIPPDTHPTLYRLYQQGISELNLPKHAWGVQAYPIMDDHLPFQQRGIPCIDIIDDFHDGTWWHTDKDNMSLISAASLQQSGRMTLFLISRLLPLQK